MGPDPDRMRRPREVAAQGLVVLLAFGVGLLVGAEHCAKPPPSPPPPEPPALVSCPEPAPCVKPAPPPAKPRRVRRRSPVKRLPAAPAPEARHREQLLDWVTARAPELAVCGTDPTGAAHLAVILHLGDHGAVRDVEISRDPGELPPARTACLRARMRRWRPPAELVKGRDRLVFGLTL